MADNVAITAGAGTVVGTDEVTIATVPVQVQYVKILDGTDGSINRWTIGADGRALVAIEPSNTSTTTLSTLTANTAATIKAANTSRHGFKLYNSHATATIFIALGATATTTTYAFPLVAGAYYEETGHGTYTGLISAISTTASATILVTEYV